MCGINGLITLQKQYEQSVMEQLVHGMNEKIIHRGPDHEGLYSDEICSLGMRRLSIIDIGTGNQPIWNATRTKCIVLNGEIYNYRELREELKSKGYEFATKSDTEVALACYEVYGIDALDRLEGMYSFCIYDKPKKKWILVRDRIGEKPLYYAQIDNAVLFGSELKSLLSTGLIPKKISNEAFLQYLQLNYIPAPLSIIEGVKKLKAAHYMIIDLKSSEIREIPYWNLDPNNSIEDDYEACKKKLRDALYSSVEKCMISDVPLGAFLSGGFDSTIISGIMADISDKPVETFTIGFDSKEYDESKLAEITAKKHRTNHHKLKLDWNETLEDLPGLLGNIDEPFADSSLVATYAVSKLAKKHVTVVLTGDAGDELFAGYDKYLIAYYRRKYLQIPKLFRKGLIEPGVHLLPAGSSIRRKAGKVISTASLTPFEQRKSLMCMGFSENMMHSLLPGEKTMNDTFLRSYYDSFIERGEQTATQYLDLKVVLEGDMLPKVDRASMLASLETRVPLLSRKVVELAFSMPEEYKINSKNRKIIMKDTFRELIPDELFSAPKSGFRVPVADWIKGPLHDRFVEITNPERLKTQGIFAPDYPGKLLNDHCMGKGDYSYPLWNFFVFQNWYESITE